MARNGIRATIEGDTLVVRATLMSERLSASGKTYLLATGKARIEHGGHVVTVALNAYRAAVGLPARERE